MRTHRRIGAAPAIGRLGIAGQFFTMDDQPWTAIDTSEFSLFKRSIDGENIAPIRHERWSIGFNMERVWLLNQSVIRWRNGKDDGQRIHPDDYPNFYEHLHAFVDTDAVVHLTVFTQTQTLMPTREDQQRHLDRTADAVRGKPNVILSLVNENDQHDNAVHPDLVRPAGVLITRGSNGADAVPPRHDAPWDAEEYHTNGLNEWQRKVGHNSMEWADQSKKPCGATENTRYPDQDNSEAHAEDAAAGAALLCAWATFHSEHGKQSQLFSATVKGQHGDCGPVSGAAAAWVRGARSVPLEFQRGQYHHRTELEGPNCIRAYDRQLPDGRVHIVRIRP